MRREETGASGAPADLQIARLSWQDIQSVYHTYLVKDFPPEEVKPLSAMQTSFLRGQYLGFGAFDSAAGPNRDLAAYAFFVVRERDCLFDYLAVREDLRGEGIGSRFLRALMQEHLSGADSVLLEIVNPRYALSAQKREECERRERFYVRNGLADTGAQAVTFGVEYKILEYPARRAHTRAETERIYASLYRSYLPEQVYARQVKIRA